MENIDECAVCLRVLRLFVAWNRKKGFGNRNTNFPKHLEAINPW